MGNNYNIPVLPLPSDIESKEILRQVNKANRTLAELKGGARTIPNEARLISTLTLQEAKDSSEIENIVTTQDDLYKAEIDIEKQFITADFVLYFASTTSTSYSITSFITPIPKSSLCRRI